MKKYKVINSIILIAALVLNLVPVGDYNCPEPDECSMDKRNCCEKQGKKSQCCCLDKHPEKPKDDPAKPAIPPVENTIKNILFLSSDICEESLTNQSVTFKNYSFTILQTSLTGNKVYKTTQTFLI